MMAHRKKVGVGRLVVQNEVALVGKLGSATRLVTKWASGPSHSHSYSAALTTN